MKVRLTIASLIATLCLAGCSSANTSSLASQPDESSTSVTASASDESRSSAGQTGQDTSEADSSEADSSEAVSSSDSESSDVKRIDYELDPSKPTIAITFDDGPNATTTMEVLDILEKYQVRASFFLIGTNINDESAKSVKRAFDLGCDIENHSKTHSYMDKMTADEIKDEVAYVNDKVKEITGTTPKFFRPPYIAVNDTMYENIDMTFISGNGCNDWDDKVTAEYRAKYLEKKAADGVIFLLHDAEGNSKTVEALDKAIPILLEKGFQFATISELFELKGIEISGTDTNIYSELIAG